MDDSQIARFALLPPVEFLEALSALDISEGDRFGVAIAVAIHRRNDTVEKFGDYLGYSRAQVTKWKGGKVKYSDISDLDSAIKIAKTLEVVSEDLLEATRGKFSPKAAP